MRFDQLQMQIQLAFFQPAELTVSYQHSQRVHVFNRFGFMNKQDERSDEVCIGLLRRNSSH